MAQYKDVLSTQSGWIHELARVEIHPDPNNVLNSSGSSDSQQMIEESTVVFLSQLKESFHENCQIFNSYSEAGKRFQEIKLYHLAHSAADFMVYRNQIKLVVNNTAHGVIQIAFANHKQGNLRVNQNASSSFDGNAELNYPREILAKIGPFREVHWEFDGQKVEAERVAKFYFEEFVRATRVTTKALSNNEVILDQIKTFLHDKGIDV